MSGFYSETEAPRFSTAMRWREEVRRAGGGADIVPVWRTWDSIEFAVRVTLVPQVAGLPRPDLLPAPLRRPRP